MARQRRPQRGHARDHHHHHHHHLDAHNTMNNEPFIPEASDPDTFVRGRLAPIKLARQVRLGWKAGVAYLIVKLAAVVLTYPEVLASPLLALFAAGEFVFVGAMVYGVYRWNGMASWLLFAFLIVSAFAGALHPPLTPAPGGATVRIAFLIAFGVVFGRAAIAIRAFDRGT